MLTADDLLSFARQLRGTLVQPEDAGYDAARAVYNAMIDRHPRAIAYCANVADVMLGVAFARENGLLLAVRGGGHNGGGLGVCDDGLVLDLSRMKGLRIDPLTRTAQVEAGCLLADVDHARAQAAVDRLGDKRYVATAIDATNISAIGR